MSRVGKKQIQVPSGVKIQMQDQRLTVKGPHGELNHTLPQEINLEHKENVLTLTAPSHKDSKQVNALYGLTRTLVANMIQGVSGKFSKELKIVGIGYRANVSGTILNLFLGFSHPIKYTIPEGIHIEVTKDNRIVIQGIDKQKVGQVAAEIRYFKRPEPYKGKGIMYKDEKIRIKVGKAGA